MKLRPHGGLFEKMDFEIEAFTLEKQWWNPALKSIFLQYIYFRETYFLTNLVSMNQFQFLEDFGMHVYCD